MKLFLLSDKLLSIEGHSWPRPGEFTAGQIPARNGNVGAYTSGDRELMVSLKSPRESLVPIHPILSM